MNAFIEVVATDLSYDGGALSCCYSPLFDHPRMTPEGVCPSKYVCKRFTSTRTGYLGSIVRTNFFEAS